MQIGMAEHHTIHIRFLKHLLDNPNVETNIKHIPEVQRVCHADDAGTDFFLNIIKYLIGKLGQFESMLMNGIG